MLYDRTAGLPIQLSGTPAGPVQPAPELGRHTEEVLLAAGYTWEELDGLRRREVIERVLRSAQRRERFP